MKITYDDDAIDAKPPGGFGANDMPARLSADIGEASGISQAAVDRGYISGADADPNYPKTPEYRRVPIVERDITRRDWYGQGDPQAEEIARMYRDMGMDPPDDLVRKEY